MSLKADRLRAPKDSARPLASLSDRWTDGVQGILLLLSLSLAPLWASAQKPVALSKADLDERFLLQINYEQEPGWQDFMTSRSRIVTFERQTALAAARPDIF